jgi:hypothetical protein
LEVHAKFWLASDELYYSLLPYVMDMVLWFANNSALITKWFKTGIFKLAQIKWKVVWQIKMIKNQCDQSFI